MLASQPGSTGSAGAGALVQQVTQEAVLRTSPLHPLVSWDPPPGASLWDIGLQSWNSVCVQNRGNDDQGCNSLGLPITEPHRPGLKQPMLIPPRPDPQGQGTAGCGPVPGSQTSSSGCVLTWPKRQGALWVLLQGSPPMMASPHDLITSQRPHLLAPSMGVGSQQSN